MVHPLKQGRRDVRNPLETQAFGNQFHNPMGIIPPQILSPVEDALVAGTKIKVLSAVLCLNCPCFGEDCEGLPHPLGEKTPISPVQGDEALIRDLLE